jgi:hypothetical protein
MACCQAGPEENRVVTWGVRATHPGANMHRVCVSANGLINMRGLLDLVPNAFFTRADATVAQDPFASPRLKCLNNSFFLHLISTESGAHTVANFDNILEKIC